VETILAEAAHLGKFCSGHLDLIDVLMASTEVAKRLPLGPNPFERPMPLAEHGFSVLIKVKQGHKEGQVLWFYADLWGKNWTWGPLELEYRVN
jgi:hypothetical protein